MLIDHWHTLRGEGTGRVHVNGVYRNQSQEGSNLVTPDSESKRETVFTRILITHLSTRPLALLVFPPFSNLSGCSQAQKIGFTALRVSLIII